MTGAGGMLGSDAVDVLGRAGEHVVALHRADLDVRDGAACLAAVDEGDLVLNAAAWTDVDGAEEHEDLAFAVNAVGAANLARACAHRGAVLVHVSTDYVFDGRSRVPYPVDAPVGPLGAYARTKAAGEWAVAALCPGSYVVRTAWLYGENGLSFPDRMLRLAEERKELRVVDDQHGQPTWTRDLVESVRSLVLSGAAFGTYHAAAAGETTWFGFAREAFRLAGLDPERVRPTTSAEFGAAASRPAYSVLADSLPMPAWEDGLARFLSGRSAR